MRKSIRKSHTFQGQGRDSSPLYISCEPSKTTSAELLYISRLTLHSWQALMTFLTPETEVIL